MQHLQGQQIKVGPSIHLAREQFVLVALATMGDEGRLPGVAGLFSCFPRDARPACFTRVEVRVSFLPYFHM